MIFEKKVDTWEEIFAWYPVQIHRQAKWVWLCRVWRRREFGAFYVFLRSRYCEYKTGKPPDLRGHGG